MPTSSDDARERLQTTGPNQDEYEQYRTITTASDETVIYDADVEDAWIQSDDTVQLREMQ